MSGARLKSFRLGDRSELLVQHLLAGIAFTTPVPRQEDVGIDFLCSLITGYDGEHLLKAGPFFAVQAKSSVDAIVYEKSHELEWITDQQNPLFLCIANRQEAAMDVYSTWNLLCGVLGGGLDGKIKPTRIVLKPGEDWNTWPGIRNLNDGTQEIYLGKPVVHITHQDIFDESRARNMADVLGQWVHLDRLNIVNRYAGLNWVLGPHAYETGSSIPLGRAVSFYWNPANLEQCQRNLSLSATALWRVLKHPQIDACVTVNAPPWIEGLAALRKLLLWCLSLSPELKSFLSDLNENQ